jgi:hypothetical protein
VRWLLPGCCPVPARFLPGSCPVPARFLPGSCPTAGQDPPRSGRIRLGRGRFLRRSRAYPLRAATGRTTLGCCITLVQDAS